MKLSTYFYIHSFPQLWHIGLSVCVCMCVREPGWGRISEDNDQMRGSAGYLDHSRG